jgi:hypothetical protein
LSFNLQTCLGVLLTTLPSLERVNLALQDPETDDQRTTNLEPLGAVGSLLCESLDSTVLFWTLPCNANALEEGSSIIDIIFRSDCYFPDGGEL